VAHIDSSGAAGAQRPTADPVGPAGGAAVRERPEHGDALFAAAGPADASFDAVAAAIVDDLLASDPELATDLGDHRFDHQLADNSPTGLERERRMLVARLAQLDAVPTAALSLGRTVAAAILRNRLAGRHFALTELREHTWNPLFANPGGALYPLLTRDYAPAAERLRAVAGRLAAVPEHLAAARAQMTTMPRVHVETALVQFAGTAALIIDEVDALLAAEPRLAAEVAGPREQALAAIERHREWLSSRLVGANRDPRIGARHFARKLSHTLDAASGADDVLRRAESHLEQIEEEIAQTAARLSGERAHTPGLVRQVLDSLADDRPDNETIVAVAERAMTEAMAFTEAHDLVTVYDDPVRIIVMPEVRRGVAVAYCDAPGVLEAAPGPTFFAISPTPADWSPARVESFYREYNSSLLYSMAAHEAVPGHMLQLGHARRFAAPRWAKAIFTSGTFIEGWAVYTEQLLVDRGFVGDRLRMCQLKMQLRTTINAILDARVHAHGMTEDEAMRLMTGRGHQEEGEAAGKWRRAQLTSTQLSTYFVGYVEVTDLVRDLRTARPKLTDRQVHDAVLAYGSAAPKYVRQLLGL
jgi:uncharacterized protein (DUF885 family)